jgi:glucose/arabinose dehydrogenase
LKHDSHRIDAVAHPMHPFVIDKQGSRYVDLGSATNSCQVRNRMPRSPGINPCTELETRAGTWRYDANRTTQHFSPSERFATGIRNGEAFAFDQAGRLYVSQTVRSISQTTSAAASGA